MSWEVFYEILVYKSKLSLFHEFNFRKKGIYVSNRTLWIFDNIVQLVFNFFYLLNQ